MKDKLDAQVAMVTYLKQRLNCQEINIIRIENIKNIWNALIEIFEDLHFPEKSNLPSGYVRSFYSVKFDPKCAVITAERLTQYEYPFNNPFETKTSDELIYGYGISHSGVVMDEVMKQDGLKYVRINDFYVIVKHVSANEYSEENLTNNLSDPLWLEKNAKAHMEVICEIMSYQAVIPFKFGTIFKTEESLKQFINDYAASIHENLVNIEGREEWAVKVYLNRQKLHENITTLSTDVQRLQHEIASSSPGKAFLLKRKKDELIQQEIERVIRDIGQRCYAELEAISESIRVLSKERVKRDGNIALNIACLINKQKDEEFVGAVKHLRAKYNRLGFDLDLTGPWPPFSFISIGEKHATAEYS